MEFLFDNIFVITLIFLFSLLVSYIMSRSYIVRQINIMDKVLDDIIAGKKADDINLSRETFDGRLYHKANKIIELSELRSTQLIADKRVVEEMIGDISHQLKTPMSNILIYGELISDECIPISDRIEFSQRIITQSKKISWLIDNLTKLARLESGIIELKIEDSELECSIEESISCIKGKIIEKGITLEISESDRSLVKKCKKWTEEAIINILDNAIKYTDHEGTIKIDIERMSFFTVLNITDSGIGIPEAEYTEIFKRFYRAKNNDVKEGIGLGLHISRTIMEKQGGYIKVSSKVGVGSTFSLFFQNCNT